MHTEISIVMSLTMILNANLTLNMKMISFENFAKVTKVHFETHMVILFHVVSSTICDLECLVSNAAEYYFECRI